ncbi:Crp/Fnr family transcriptional regulator [Streptomyces globisporus]
MFEHEAQPLLLTEAETSLIRGAGRRRSWRGGETLFAEGDAPREVVYIEVGVVKATSDARNGYTSLLALRGPGELVGELACIDGRPRSATVTAMREIRGTAVAADRFLRLLAENGPLALSITRIVSVRLRQANRLRALQGALPTTARVARVLLDLWLGHGTGDGRSPTDRAVLVSQVELAGAAGTSRESVVRALRLLQENRLITTSRGRILVHDAEALGRWSGC